MMEGYVKIHRGLLEWGWYKDANTMRVFMDILLNANYKDGEYMGHPIKAGQCVIGRKALAERLGISEQSVRTALAHLKSTGEITIKTTNKFSVATVEKWAEYQVDEATINQQNNQQDNQQLTNNQPTTNQQLTTSKKERKKEINNMRANELRSEFDELWSLYPRKQGKATAYRHYETARRNGTEYMDVEKGVKAYAAYAKGKEAQYVKMGSTFFSQKAWEDDWTIPKETPKPKSNVPYQPEPPKYPMFEPDPVKETVQTPDYIKKRLRGMFD